MRPQTTQPPATRYPANPQSYPASYAAHTPYLQYPPYPTAAHQMPYQYPSYQQYQQAPYNYSQPRPQSAPPPAQTSAFPSAPAVRHILSCSHCKQNGHTIEVCRQRLGAGPSFCSFCNIPGHTFDNCRKRYGPCIHCGRTGHQSTECFSLKKRGHSEYDGPATQRAAFKKFKGQKERPHEEKRANVRRSPSPFPSRILLNIMSNLTLQDILTLRLVAHPLSILTFQTLYAHHSINFNRLWIKICTHGSLGQFTALINEFPNIDLLTQDDCACYRAAVTGNIPIVKRIHELAAVDQATQRAIVQSNDYEPLRIAAVCGRLTILRLIYEYCSLEDRRASRFHLPTIKEVVVRGHGEVLKQLFMWCDEGEQMGMLRVCLGLAVELGNGEIAGWGLKEGLRMGLKISLKVEDEVKEELPDELVEISDDGNEDCK